MSEVQVINGVAVAVEVTELDLARKAVGEGFKKTGEVITHYAKTLNKVFGANWWSATGETKKAVKAERDKFKDMGTALLNWTANNVDQQWRRVQIAAGRPEKVSEPKLQGGNDIDAKTTAELKTMLNRILGADEDECPLSQKAKRHLLDAAEAMGIDTAKDLKH